MNLNLARFRLNRLRAISSLIGEALSRRAGDRARRALCVANAQLDAVRMPEIKLSDVAVQMLFTTMLINAFHAALKDAVKALDRVGVNLAAPILASAVIDIFVTRELFAKVCILAGFVGHDSGFFRDVGAKNRDQMSGGRTAHMKASNLAAALDK
jgi:hypothetical protein